MTGAFYAITHANRLHVAIQLGITNTNAGMRRILEEAIAGGARKARKRERERESKRVGEVPLREIALLPLVSGFP